MQWGDIVSPKYYNTSFILHLVSINTILSHVVLMYFLQIDIVTESQDNMMWLLYILLCFYR